MRPEIKISVFGLGKLGCTMLACFAHKGWQVTGVDIYEPFVTKINNGESPIYEPGVDALIKASRKNITATVHAQEAVQNSDVSFIIVPTPSEKSGSFNTRAVESVARSIAQTLKTKNNYHLIVVTSTVLPGNTASIVQLLENESGKKCNRDFGVCYNPDFIALGSIVRDFLNPDMILIGESDKKAGDLLSSIHEHLVDSQPSIHRMTFENAELTKISLNAYCTLKITYANVLAEICEKFPGGDVDVVTRALGADTRIGNKYLKGGLSYGGPCFPRDNKAFAWTAQQLGVSQMIALRTDEVNEYHRSERIPEKLSSILSEYNGNRIAVLGLTYKADTTLVEESAALSVIRKLLEKNISVSVYDPAGMNEAKAELGNSPHLNFTSGVKECLAGADLCFIASPWKEFSKLTEQDFIGHMKHPVIFDAWNILQPAPGHRLDYRQIGKYHND